MDRGCIDARAFVRACVCESACEVCSVRVWRALIMVVVVGHINTGENPSN